MYACHNWVSYMFALWKESIVIHKVLLYFVLVHTREHFVHAF